jgi:hypothetical protein
VFLRFCGTRCGYREVNLSEEPRKDVLEARLELTLATRYSSLPAVSEPGEEHVTKVFEQIAYLERRRNGRTVDAQQRVCNTKVAFRKASN